MATIIVILFVIIPLVIIVGFALMMMLGAIAGAFFAGFGSIQNPFDP